VSRRPTSVEHAATTLALVAALPRLPFRKRSTVGLLTFAVWDKRSGRMSLARTHRSNGVSNLIGITITPLGWHGRAGRVAAGSERQREKVPVHQFRASVVGTRVKHFVPLGRLAASRHNSHALLLSPKHSVRNCFHQKVHVIGSAA
jgi:hypothetical protein